jgi:glutamate racemase
VAVNEAPIGIFDSGVGGLTVARSILDQLPQESTLYIGDTLNTPYGSKPLAAVRAHALAVMDDLADAGVKMLVIACNTASSAVLRDARERYELRHGLPVVEVILPAARRAVLATRTGRIGVIGTHSTIQSRAYDDAFAVAPGVHLTSQACPRFVEFVEAGITSGPELMAVAHEYLDPVRAAGVDTLVLGCTHYPLMSAAIQYVMGEQVTLVSSAEETAFDVYRTLVRHGIERGASTEPTHVFEATGGSKDEFTRLVRRFLGPEVSTVELVETGTLYLPNLNQKDPSA